MRMDALAHAIAKNTRLLEAICNNLGINTASIPGYIDPPSTLPPLSPSLQLASSPGIQVSNLTISDTHSIGSSHSSIRSRCPRTFIQPFLHRSTLIPFRSSQYLQHQPERCKLCIKHCPKCGGLSRGWPKWWDIPLHGTKCGTSQNTFQGWSMSHAMWQNLQSKCIVFVVVLM